MTNDDINKTLKDIFENGIEIKIVNTKIEVEGLIVLMGLYYFRN